MDIQNGRLPELGKVDIFHQQVLQESRQLSCLKSHRACSKMGRAFYIVQLPFFQLAQYHHTCQSSNKFGYQMSRSCSLRLNHLIHQTTEANYHQCTADSAFTHHQHCKPVASCTHLQESIHCPKACRELPFPPACAHENGNNYEQLI